MTVLQNNSPLIFFISNSDLDSYKQLEQHFIDSADKIEIGPDQEKIGFVLYGDPDVSPYHEDYIPFSGMLYQEFLKSQYGIINRIDLLQYDTDRIKNFIRECLVKLFHIAVKIKKEPILNKDGLYQYIIQLNELFKSHYDWYLDDEMQQLIVKTSQILKGKKQDNNQSDKILTFKSLVEPQKIDSLFETIKNRLISGDVNTQEKFRLAFSAVELTEPLKIRWQGKSLTSLFRFIDLLSEIGVIEQDIEKKVKAKIIGNIFVKSDGSEFQNIGNSINNHNSSKWDMLEGNVYPQIKLLFNESKT